MATKLAKKEESGDIVTSLLKFYKDIPPAYKAVVAGLLFEMIRRQIANRNTNKDSSILEQLKAQELMLKEQNEKLEMIIKKLNM